MKYSVEFVSDIVKKMLPINSIEFIGCGNHSEAFYEYFDKGCFPARMTSTSKFLDKECLCMIDGVAYKKQTANDRGDL